jgi:Glycosyl transferases group 1
MLGVSPRGRRLELIHEELRICRSRRVEKMKELLRPYYLRWVYFRLFPARRPESFVAPWRYRFGRFPAPRLEPPPPVANLPDLVLFPMTDWHARLQRTQHLTRAFARLGHRCLYVNPHLGRQFETTPLFDRASRLVSLEENIWELHVRLPREPVFHHRLLTSDESCSVAAAVRQALDWMGTRRAVLLASLPIWLHPAQLLRDLLGWPLVYDCHDLLAGFANMAPEIVNAESQALQSADLVLFSSPRLAELFAAGKPFLLLRNAVDFAHFASVPAASDGQPVAGYVGALERWFDVAALHAAASATPNCCFLLAGRVENPRIEALRALSNLEFLGEVPYARLPEIYARFRVGLIPFLINELTLATNPIKLYEYFSRGLPVVTAPLPEVEAFGDLVYPATSPAAFAAQLRCALAEDDPGRRARRVCIARQESWSARATLLAGELRRFTA